MSIENLRNRIDRIDALLVRLLNHRVKAAQEIGKLKQANGSAVYAPSREAAIYRRLFDLNAGPLPNEAIRSIYTEIISACRASEKNLRIAFLGPEGTFSHQATRQQFGSNFESVPVRAIEQVFAEVEASRADYGVVPVENSVEGGIGETLNGLMESDLKICAEILVRIHHNLMALPPLVAVERIYSKAEALAQCKSYLSTNYPDAVLVETSSTAEAARLAAKEKHAAAIAHLEMAHRFGMEVLHRAIEDSPFNMTRFLVLSRDLAPASGQDKTSILCFVRDEIGALLNILTPLKDLGVNLTKIESWPSRRKPWDYCFFIDFLGHYEEPAVSKALERVAGRCKEMKLLGSYPAAPAEQSGAAG